MQKVKQEDKDLLPTLLIILKAGPIAGKENENYNWPEKKGSL